MLSNKTKSVQTDPSRPSRETRSFLSLRSKLFAGNDARSRQPKSKVMTTTRGGGKMIGMHGLLVEQREFRSQSACDLLLSSAVKCICKMTSNSGLHWELSVFDFGLFLQSRDFLKAA